MNKERILELAQHIESLPHKPLEDFNRTTEAFNMRAYVQCGAPCCIAGWACKMFTDDMPHGDTFRQFDRFAAKALAIYDSGISNKLFDPATYYPDFNHGIVVENNDITPKQAAQTLRHLAETGEVVWFDEEGNEI